MHVPGASHPHVARCSTHPFPPLPKKTHNHKNLKTCKAKSAQVHYQARRQVRGERKAASSQAAHRRCPGAQQGEAGTEPRPELAKAPGGGPTRPAGHAAAPPGARLRARHRKTPAARRGPSPSYLSSSPPLASGSTWSPAPWWAQSRQAPTPAGDTATALLRTHTRPLLKLPSRQRRSGPPRPGPGSSHRPRPGPPRCRSAPRCGTPAGRALC